MTEPIRSARPPGGSFLPLILALLLGLAALITLSFLTLGFFSVFLAVGFGLALFIGLQYLIWGWWLGRVLRDKSQVDDAEP